MKMLNIETKQQVNDLNKISRGEAYQFLEEGVSIVCRVSSREFQQVFNMRELGNLERLEQMRIYDELEFYLQ